MSFQNYYSTPFGYRHPIEGYSVEGGLQGAIFSSHSWVTRQHGELVNGHDRGLSHTNNNASAAKTRASTTSSFGDTVVMACRDFSIGYCKRGDQCHFLYAIPASESAAVDTNPAISVTTTPLPCRFFARGTCRNGEQCPYLHNTTTSADTEEGTTLHATRQLYKFFLLNGQCRAGEKCHFVHNISSDYSSTYQVSEMNKNTFAVDEPENAQYDDLPLCPEDWDYATPIVAEQMTHAECDENADVNTFDFEDKINEVRRLVRVNAAKTHQMGKEAINLDLVIVMDCTSSMARWINEAKLRVKDVIDQVKVKYQDSKVRIGFVAYRDFCDEHLHCEHIALTEDVEAVKRFIASQHAVGGGDEPEDVSIGLQTAIQLLWRAGARCIILVCDEPCHGMLYHNYGPGGDSPLSKQKMASSPDVCDLMRTVAKLGIDFVVMEIHYAATRKMFSAMANAYALAPTPADGHKRRFHAMQMPRHTSGRETFDKSISEWFAPKLVKIAKSSIAASITRHSNGSTSLSRSLDYHPHHRVKTLQDGTRFTTLGRIQEDADEDSNYGDDSEEENNWQRSSTETSRYTIKTSLDFNAVTQRLPEEHAIRYTVYVRRAVSQSKSIFEDPLQFKVVKQNTLIKLDRSYFAEGAMRTAHGMYDTNIAKYAVAKVYKASQKQGQFDIVQRDANSQALAKLLAREYSIRCHECYSQVQGDPHVGQIESTPTVDFVLASFYELVHVPSDNPFKYFSSEPYLAGDYKKYNSNNGWHCSGDYARKESMIAESFSHFTFQHTNGNLMVVDCQGVGTIFTDPQIHSFSPNDQIVFGEGNRGTQGMADFFLHHDCNDICRRLGLVKILKPGGHDKQRDVTAVSTISQMKYHSDEMEFSCDLCGALCRGSIDKFMHLASMRRQIFCRDCQLNVKTFNQTAICQNSGCNEPFQFPAYWYANMGMEFPKFCNICRKSRII